MTFSEDWFWNEVSGDHEAQQKSASLVHGKVAVATWWPFLSHASSEQDFENRLSVVSNKIEASVDPDVYEDVVSSLRDDYRAVREASKHDAGSTSPQLAEFNDGLKSHKADLSNSEYFINGRWVTASEGTSRECPNCHGEGQLSKGKKDERDCPNCGGSGWTKKATNYQPDPNAAWRYHQPYEQLREPVHNGDLQDADGFVADLAQGEDRSNPVIEQRQLTPGQWHDVPGTAMPERPMPFSQQRGYRSVAARDDHALWAQGYFDTGRAHATQGQPPRMKGMNGANRDAYIDGYNHGYAGQHRVEGSLAYDADGFLVEASDVAQEGVAGRASSPLVDPAPGTPQRVNPFYFNDQAAMGANEGFPVQPSADPQDRVNEIYGETPPQASAGSQQGTIDGNGYSRSHPGESPDFSGGGKTAATDGKIVDHCPGCDKPRRVHSTMHGDEIRHIHNDHVRCHGSKTAAGVDATPEMSAGPSEMPETGDMGMDDDMQATAASLPQFFDPTLSSGNVHTADYLGRPETNNLEGRGDNAYDAANWQALQRRAPVQPLTGDGGMNPSSRDDGVRAGTTRDADQRGVPGRRAEPGDDEAEED